MIEQFAISLDQVSIDSDSYFSYDRLPLLGTGVVWDPSLGDPAARATIPGRKSFAQSEPGCRRELNRDIFGNSIALASFSEPADLLEFSSEAVVCRRDHTSHRRLLDVLPIKFPVRYSEIEASVAGGYLDSVYRTETEELREWAEATFAPNSGDDAVLLVERINGWIHRSVRYRRREDRGVQSSLETLRLGSGSCRDMATLLLEPARALRLAARFASGATGR